MSLELFLKGIVIGVSISLPVGPIWLLCINRTMAKGWSVGFITGLGSALADATYGLIAGLGVSSILGFINSHMMYVRIVGGAILMILGGYVFFVHSYEKVHSEAKRGFVGSLVSGYLVTFTNPMNLIAFTAVFASLGLVNQVHHGMGTIMSLVSGMFLGALIWWASLSRLADHVRKKTGIRIAYWTNKISGILIGLLGFGAAVSSFFA